MKKTFKGLTITLLNAACKAAKACKKSVIPVTECLKFDVTENKLVITGSSPEITIKTSIDVEAKEEFSFLINANFFTSLLSKLKMADTKFELTEDCITIINGKTKVLNPLIDIVNWVELVPEDEDIQSVEVSANDIKETLDGCIHAIGTSNCGNVVMESMLLLLGEGTKAIALDGHRIAIRDYLEDQEKFAILAKGSILREVAKLLSNKVTVTKGEKGSIVTFQDKNSVINIRTTCGKFFNYTSLVDGLKPSLKVTVDKNELYDTLALASLVDNNIELTIAGLGIQIECKSLSEFNTLVLGKIEGSDKALKIGANAAFIMDALKTIDDADVTIEFTTAVSPFLMSGISYKEIILPIQIAK